MKDFKLRVIVFDYDDYTIQVTTIVKPFRWEVKRTMDNTQRFVGTWDDLPSRTAAKNLLNHLRTEGRL